MRGRRARESEGKARGSRPAEEHEAEADNGATVTKAFFGKKGLDMSTLHACGHYFIDE